MILLRTLFSIVSAIGVLVALHAAELRGDGIGDAGLHDQVQQAHSSKGEIFRGSSASM